MAYNYGQAGYGGGDGGNPQAGGTPGYGQGNPGYGAGGYGGSAPAGYGGGHPGQWGGAPGGIEPQIAQWFQSVDTDRSGRITAKELQQALMNGNWSQFNEDTCRLMIGMFDRDRSGTIDISEFQSLWHYIQQWRSTFERFDSNRSGSIEGTELQTAYQQMGFHLSPNFVQLVVFKFDPAHRRALTLDNFIQSCVLLNSLTTAFQQRDKDRKGVVTLGYEDFMTLAVSYKP